MKIAYCVSKITNSGGTERVLANKSKYLLDKGYDVYFILGDKVTEKPFFEFDSRIKFYNLDCDFVEKGLKKHLSYQKYKKIYLERLEKALNEIKPDIAISTFGKYTRLLYQIKDGSKKIIERHFGKYKRPRYISKFEDKSWGRKLAYFYRKSDYDVVKHYDKFVVLTEEDQKLWGNLPNITTIPNSITFVPEIKSTTTEKRIIAVGRNCKQKQLDVLIRIWARIASCYPDWHLVTYGNGNLEALRSLAKELNIEGQVINNPPTSSIQDEMVNSSIYALTSKYEGMPMVLLEAMACGLPLVSFACKCGPRDIITEGVDGFLIFENDHTTFAEKLSLLIENEELRHKMGRAASLNVLRFSEDTAVMAKWISLFDELMETN